MAWIAPIPPSPRHPKPRWQVRYQDGRRQRSAGIYNTPAAAEAARKRVDRGLPPTLQAVPIDVDAAKAQTLFGDYVQDVWWPTWKAQHPDSAYQTGKRIEKWILPAFGALPFVNRPGILEAGLPLVLWSRVVGFSCHGGSGLELYRGEHAECAVAPGAVVEDLQVLKDRVGQLDPSAPALPVQQFDLHPGPERLDHRIVIAISNAAHRWHQARVSCALGERPGSELHALVGVDDGTGRWRAGLDGHAQRVGHQSGGREASIDQPTTRRE
jgi:hypothetical protein